MRFAGNVSGRVFESHLLCSREAFSLFLSVASGLSLIDGG